MAASFHEYDEPFEQIRRHFSEDVEVLNKLAEYCALKEDYDNAVIILDRVLQLRPDVPDSLLLRAVCKIELTETREAADDLLACLRLPTQDANHVRSILGKVREIAPHRLAEAADALSAQGFPGLSRRDLAEFLCNSEDGVVPAAGLLRELLATLPDEKKASEADGLVPLLLQARCWKEAIRLLEVNGMENLSPIQLFDLALAYWGETGEMPETLCRLTLERSESAQEFGHLAYSQGMSWLHWRTGNHAEAMRLLNEAEELGRGEQDYRTGEVRIRHTGPVFSLWRYRRVSLEQFLDDCRLMRRMIQGEPLRPVFLGPASSRAQA